MSRHRHLAMNAQSCLSGVDLLCEEEGQYFAGSCVLLGAPKRGARLGEELMMP